ncbi:MAG TPA: tetratricopeptide repeat protein [Longimicrobiales bacterium]|nr:tetratricopeptide repeat protein [Longimicrobiales bacterium]
MGAEVDQVLQEALALGDEGRWEEMAGKLVEALEHADDDPYLLCWLGVAERELGNDGAAYDYFRRCLEQQPSDPHLLAMAGSGLAAFDDPEAESALRAAALTGPNVVAARLQYGAYLARAGIFPEALEHLRAASELAPDDPTVHGELGVAHALNGDLDAAVGEFEQAVEIAPDDSWTRLLLGLVYLEIGMEEEAAEALIQASEEREEDAEAHALAALAASVVGWEDAAHAALARAEAAAAGIEVEMLQEVEERVIAGARAARTLLAETVGPSILRERLSEPL